MTKPQPWTPADATDEIRRIALSGNLWLALTKHAREQMEERSLISGDVLYVLKNGFVYEACVESTRPGMYKYQVESRSPNSGSRTVRIVAIPDEMRCHIKVVTVMWVDQ